VTPRDRARAAIAQAFRERIERALRLNETMRDVSSLDGSSGIPAQFIIRSSGPRTPVVFDPPLDAAAVEALAEAAAAHVADVLDAYRYPLTQRKHTAMAVRLADQWRLIEVPVVPDLPATGTIITSRDGDSLAARPYYRTFFYLAHIEDDAMRLGHLPARIVWPSNVSLDEVAATIERGRDPGAKVIARSMRAGLWYVAGEGAKQGVHELHAGAIVLRPEAYRVIDPSEIPGTYRTLSSLDGGEAVQFAIVADPELRAALESSFYPSTAALVAWAEKVVADDQEKARAIPLPAHRAAGVAWQLLALPKHHRTEDRAALVEAIRGGGVRIVWDGKPRGEQLRFAFADLDVSMSMALGIKEALGAEGLRDYAILHRMAAQQGRSGTFKWTWAAHRHATRHASRVRSSNTTDDEACDAVVKRIWKLARAQLHVEVEVNGKRAWKVVGEDPLVFVTGGVEVGRRIEGLTLRLNAALYEGAKRDAAKPYFTFIPEAVLDLPASALCLAVMLVFRWRIARDKGGVVELDEAALLRLMDETVLPASRHNAAATKKLHATLAQVAEAMGSGFAWEPVEGGKYRVTPPRFWVDSVVHGATPVLPPTTTDAPGTGRELVAWRDKNGLTQARAAELLSVSVRTIRNAELAGDVKLPRSFVDVHWEAARPRRALTEKTDG
jgi:hypothetical protein